MEQQTATAETGVTEQEATPAEATPASEAEVSSEVKVDEALTPAQARIQKLANENRQYRERLQRQEEDAKTLEGARYLHQLLTKDPQKARVVMDLLEGRSQSSDPFEGYQPHEAEALRAAMEFKQWKAEQERIKQAESQRNAEENKLHLEEVFYDRLMKDGYVSKNGEYDEVEVNVISRAVLAEAYAIAKDPNRISERELNTAYENIIKGTKAFEKRALKSTVRASPPPSASQKGSVPIGKTKETEEQRISRMVKELQAGA